MIFYLVLCYHLLVRRVYLVAQSDPRVLHLGIVTQERRSIAKINGTLGGVKVSYVLTYYTPITLQVC